jgi:hypothetical protein
MRESRRCSIFRAVDQIVDDFVARYTLNVPTLDTSAKTELPRQCSCFGQGELSWLAVITKYLGCILHFSRRDGDARLRCAHEDYADCCRSNARFRW